MLSQNVIETKLKMPARELHIVKKLEKDNSKVN